VCREKNQIRFANLRQVAEGSVALSAICERSVMPEKAWHAGISMSFEIEARRQIF
jgi:hypothetical protein